MTVLRIREFPPWYNKSFLSWERSKIKLNCIKKALAQCAEKYRYYNGYYLDILAVEPTLQGQGVGRSLLNILSSTADRHRVPMFLETHGERNETIYSKFGFKVKGIIPIDVSKYNDIKPIDRFSVVMKRDPNT
mmetsp:Transcript_11848/g.13777  ORF Transcript_11848/g.13777 Transcript_11848/m.13777 type:complete len:133 (-) Transcript_11848:115-513(-)